MAKGFTDIQNFTYDQIAPKMVDSILNSNVLLQVILNNNVGKFNSNTHREVVKYQKGGTTTSFTGLEKFDRNYKDVSIKLTFEPKFQQHSIVIPGIDLSVSKTSNSVIDLMVNKAESAAQDFADDLGTIVYADGTGTNNISGLKTAIKTSGTYGGVDVAVYTSLAGGVNATSYTTGGTKFSLAALDAGIRTARSGNIKPNVIVCSEAVYTIIEALIPVTQNVNVTNATGGQIKGKVAALAANTGYDALYYKGIPIIADEKCGNTELYILNTDFWKFLKFDMVNTRPVSLASRTIEGQYDKNVEKQIGFYMTDWRWSQDQYATFADIFLSGELICTNPRYQYRFTDIQG